MADNRAGSACTPGGGGSDARSRRSVMADCIFAPSRPRARWASACRRSRRSARVVADFERSRGRRGGQHQHWRKRSPYRSSSRSCWARSAALSRPLYEQERSRGPRLGRQRTKRHRRQSGRHDRVGPFACLCGDVGAARSAEPSCL